MTKPLKTEVNMEKITLRRAQLSVLLTEYCAGGKIEKNEMGGACGAYGAGEAQTQMGG